MVERQADPLQTPSLLLRPFTPIPRAISIHYRFSTTTKPAEQSHTRSTFTLPIFNSDKQFFTPAFILNLDYNYYRVNMAYEGQKFEQRIKESKQQMSKNDLDSPLPSQNFCQICRTNFDNYHQHISSRSHLNCLRKSKGNQYITEICRFLTKATQIKQKKNTNKQTLNQPLCTRKVKIKGKSKSKKIVKKNNNFSRDVSGDSIRPPLTTQISFERE